MAKAGPAALSRLGRFYVYGLHGFALEVVFCALWGLIADLNVKLHGYSSIWSFGIYGASLLVMEEMKAAMDARAWSLPARALAYTLWTYVWELSCGVLLSMVDAHSWDYAPYAAYHYLGLVNFDYAPLWLFITCVADRVLIPCTLKLHV
eukprot:TRINITY_DN10902_c0_g1_i1.p2 TRINITY_DN10902_c0_g1~~TRINITY_DN10902_c0_g1_i1.p2  ORF type:complete len:149 (+),score=48.38 TRINITY_DN10902_c0_g1_i1:128-574(+)